MKAERRKKSSLLLNRVGTGTVQDQVKDCYYKRWTDLTSELAEFASDGGISS